MSQAVRAIYENGVLRPLDPVSLSEGEQIELLILSEQERVKRALTGSLVHFVPELLDPIDEASLLLELDRETQGKPSVSDDIIEERRNGP